MKRIFTIDVEEYYHAENVLTSFDEESFQHLPHRVDIGAKKILDLLERNQSRATFFVLGCEAETHKELIRTIASRGHEIATHGFYHTPLYKHDARSFNEDLERSVKALSDITGERILGYRATSFSLSKKHSPWFFDILRKCGLRYDSSASVSWFRPSFEEINIHPDFFEISEGILEFPISYARIGPLKIPLGGGYFRAYPYAFNRWALEHACTNGKQTSLFYIHPWELDPDQPHLKLPLVKFLRHYLNLSGTEKKLEHLLQDMKFVSIRDILNSNQV